MPELGEKLRGEKVTLFKRIYRTCYRRIDPHLKRYETESDIEKCLPLMEPSIFAKFAKQACKDVAQIVADETDMDDDKLVKRLMPCLSEFGCALEQFSAAFHRFKQVMAQARRGAWNNGMANAATAIDTFGGLTGILVGAVGGYMTGEAAARQMQPECNHIQEAFGAMLVAYDRAMDSLAETVAALLSD